MAMRYYEVVRAVVTSGKQEYKETYVFTPQKEAAFQSGLKRLRQLKFLMSLTTRDIKK